jgi:hypothetical protein
MSRPLRVWRESYAVRRSYGGSALLSAAAHAGLIALAVVVTRTAPDLIREEIAEFAVRFHIPEDRAPGQAPQQERIQWMALGVAPGTGPLVDMPSGQSADGRPAELDFGFNLGDAAITVNATPRLAGMDSAYTIVEVDSTVQRDPFSAAPSYPAELLAAGVQGSSMVRYVVDTTGRADMRTFQELRTTHEGFTASVREALPLMRFTPAKIGPMRVRQLVEQEFFFKIDPSVVQAARRDQGAPSRTP